MNNLSIGIDLGGTRIKGVVIDEAGLVLEQCYTSTNDDGDAAWKEGVRETVQKLQTKIDDRATVIGMSAPGLPDAANRVISFMPGRMQGLENFLWEEFLHKPTYILNDAVAAMMAEARLGAAAGFRHAIMLTLGTGVGGAILIDGRIYQGAFQKAGHLGHMVVDHSGDPDVTGMPGSLEECIGNCTIEKRSNGRYSSTHLLLEAYAKDDPFAKEIWLTSVRQLAIALASLTNILSPEIIVLGGGIAEANSLLLEPLEKYMAQYEWRAGGHRAQIRKAAHADLSGAIGAAVFAREKRQGVDH
jgi:glucokinase